MTIKSTLCFFSGWLILAIAINVSAAVSVSVSPTSDTVLPGSVRSIYSNVQGDANIAVTWDATCGTLVDSAGYTTWTAPAAGSCTVTATSVADNTKSSSTVFIVTSANVKTSNIPAQATIFKGQSIGIQSILWGSTNNAVTWSNSGGTLTGTGREVIFTANTAGTYIVTATSVADNTKSAITTLVVTDSMWPGAATANNTMPIDCTATGSGITYEVTDETSMDAVPWSTLGAGDTVRIHPGVYHKQILISTSGTESQPIRVCGVADVNGNLPELNGANASAKVGSNYGAAPYGLQTYGGIVIYKNGASYYGGESYPKNIIIEGLKVTGFHPTNSCYDLSLGGVLTHYVNGAAPVRIQHGKNITIRGNDFQNSGNGFFVMSNNGVESKTTRNLLVEGNYFYDNGVTTYEHQSYIQALGLVVQGNYYDHAKIGVLGSQLKTRSVQQFVRYNYFEPAGRVFDLVEIQDSPALVFPWVGLDPNELINTSTSDVVANYEAYQNRYVYGNIVHNVSNDTATYKTSASVIHISADNDQTYQPGGNLYFYNNTLWLSLISSETSNWRNIIVDAGPYGVPISTHTIFPTARLFNNVVYINQSSPSSGRVFSWNSKQADRVFLDKNWVSVGWGTGNSAGGDGTGISASPGDNVAGVWQGGQLATQVTGISNLVTGATIPFDSDSYVPKTGSPLINSSTLLTGLAISLPPLMQYSPMTHLMSIRGDINDIGAIGVDRIPPIVNITTAITPINTSSATLSGTATDNIGIASVSVQLVGSLQPTMATISGSSWSVTLPGLVEGSNSITVTASDTSGNISQSKTVTVIVDITLPTLVLTSVASPIVQTSQAIIGTVSDNLPGVSVKVKVNSATPVAASVTGDNWTFNATNLVIGSNSITVTATDTSGNSTTLPTATITRVYPGPANTDGIITLGDAVLALRYVMGLETPTAEQLIRSDLAPLGSNWLPKGNGKLDDADIILMLRKVIGAVNW